jgi:hypothetical protein
MRAAYFATLNKTHDWPVDKNLEGGGWSLPYQTQKFESE